jgi:glycosyltransferase involved in cell wall biosynthesis
MKLLAFTRLYWPEGGGAELATHLILNMLAKQFDIALVSGTPHSRTEISYRVSKYMYWRAFELSFKPLDSIIQFFLNSAVRRSIEEADVIYVHSPLNAAILAKKVNPKAKVILHLHNFQPISYSSVLFHGENCRSDVARSIRLELFENRSLSKALLSGILSFTNIENRIALFYADRIICVSNRQAEILKKTVEGVGEKIRVIYNLLPNAEETEKSPAEKPTMLYLGGESYIKGFHVVQAALSKLRLETEVICAGEYRNGFPKLLNAKIVGRIDHDAVRRLYRKAWAVLVPSIVEEPMPYAVAEASAMGTIPIASRIGGIPEMAKGTYAEKTLFTPNNVDDFVNKIREVSTLSREEIVEIGAQLKQNMAKMFEYETIRRQFLEALACA